MPAPRSTSCALRSFAIAACLGAVPALVIGVAYAPPVAAFFDAPAPKVDCSKKQNRTKPQCQKSQLAPPLAPAPALAARPASDEVFFAAYGLARAGQYAAALDILKTADQSDPRVLNYQGFATRKLGNVDGALPFYRRALDINPDYVLARAYLGEAYLQKGDIVQARGQLAEIDRRCGRICAEYADLAMQIDAHDTSPRGG